jgi:hypothetical protein
LSGQRERRNAMKMKPFNASLFQSRVIEPDGRLVMKPRRHNNEAKRVAVIASEDWFHA